MRDMNVDVREEMLAGLRRVISAEALASVARRPPIEDAQRLRLVLSAPQPTDRVKAALVAVIGPDDILDRPAQMSSEDFGALPDAIGVRGAYCFFGGMPEEVIDGDEPAPSNTSPLFAPVLEPTLITGVTTAYTAIMSGNGRDTGGA